VTDEPTSGPVDRGQPEEGASGDGQPAEGLPGPGAAQPPPTERLPLFPLGTVLLPGLLLPLQIFEPRYRELVGELLEQPEDEVRQFGVVAIRHGREVGPERPQLYEVGCTAVVRRAQRMADGRYSLMTAGERRFVVRSVDDESRPYLVGEVTYLADEPGEAEPVAALVPSVQGLLKDYTAKLAENKALDIQLPDLPDDPVTLSYLVAAAVVPDIAQRQGLLEAPDALSRLRAEQVMLRRELGLLGSITTVASPGLTRIPPSLN
jgi:Lon protease-like protein